MVYVCMCVCMWYEGSVCHLCVYVVYVLCVWYTHDVCMFVCLVCVSGCGVGVCVWFVCICVGDVICVCDVCVCMW